MKMTGAEIVVKTLIAQGADAIFGYPGGTVLDIFDELYKNRGEITHYITCHEQGAAHAADGYARATGKTGVVLATSGPGSTNLVTGLATAYLDSTPMVAITGNVPLPMIGKDSFQEVDITGITMPVTKHNYIIKNIEELEDTICEAFKIANSKRPGPVLIDIPKDIQKSVCEFKGGGCRPRPPQPPVSEKAVERAVQLINESRKPLIYAGGGVLISDAVEELNKFADLIDAPIGCSMMGLTAVRADSKRRLGMTGMHGSYAACKATAEADLIIGVGVRFSDRATGNKEEYQRNAKILHIDIDAAEIDKNVEAYTSILGNAKEVLSLLSASLAQRDNRQWVEEIERFKQEDTGYYTNGDGNLSPKAVIEGVNRHAAEDTVIATDVGQHQMWVAQNYKFDSPRTFLTSGGLGTMGFGMGAAIGASVAKGGKKTVLFTGDGSFHMNFNEVVTAVSHRLPVVVVILNNSVLGMVRQWQSLFFGSRYSNTTLNRQTDYVKLAEAMGAAGYRITQKSEIDGVMEKAFAEKRPVIIDCVIDKNEKVLPMIPPNGSIKNIILR